MQKTYRVTDQIKGFSATGRPYTHTGQGLLAVDNPDEQDFLDFFPYGVTIAVTFLPDDSGAVAPELDPNAEITLTAEPIPEPTIWQKLTRFVRLGR